MFSIRNAVERKIKIKNAEETKTLLINNIIEIYVIQ